jgi:hypothetical protein
VKPKEVYLLKVIPCIFFPRINKPHPAPKKGKKESTRHNAIRKGSRKELPVRLHIPAAKKRANQTKPAVVTTNTTPKSARPTNPP